MKRIALLIAGALLLAAGCSYQDFSRPVLRNYFADALHRSKRPPDMALVEADPFEETPAKIARWQKMAAGVADEYHVGADDVLKVVLIIPSDTSASMSLELPVAREGTIECPLVGKVSVAGMSATAVADKLRKLYAEGYFKAPLVSVTIGEYRNKHVLVSGSVDRPGVIALRSNRTTLVQAILEAGGITQAAGPGVFVTRMMPTPDDQVKAESLRFSLEKLLSRSGAAANIWLLPGDIVHVPRELPSEPRYFYVLGYVNTPGAFELPEHGVVRLMDAIAHAHGLADSGRAENTRLIRQTPRGQQIYPIDLTRVASGKESDVLVYPDDRIIVGTSWTRRSFDGFLRFTGVRSLAPAY